MLWYHALVPAVTCALVVRLDAIFLGPYWSWLQLIPEPGSHEEAGLSRQRRRALARRVLIPLITSFLLVAVWPETYSRIDAATVSVLAAALLLWPLIFARPWQEVRRPRSLVAGLYALLVVTFATSGYIGAVLGMSIIRLGGIVSYVQDEALSLVISSVAVLFATDAFGRASEVLRRKRDEDIL